MLSSESTEKTLIREEGCSGLCVSESLLTVNITLLVLSGVSYLKTIFELNSKSGI